MYIFVYSTIPYCMINNSFTIHNINTKISVLFKYHREVQNLLIHYEISVVPITVESDITSVT